ncbi:MAG: hypothetical protein K9L98_03450 [Candidatus Pacebacteria bacterium]|nr:hypothetical protein [Candidatus Paceibacterota bacterium]MCF7863034.1 hypothetical protein [Candidatus Paceibacterota bacterium]
MRLIFKKTLALVLKAESTLVLSKYKPKIIAITGSVGKTSTKDAIYATLVGTYHVRKSEKSYNSELGLPLTILGLPNGWNDPLLWIKNIFKGLWLFIWPHKYPKWLVLEVGIGKPGDMKKTAGWLKSDAVVITAITETPPHVEFFESRKHLIEEKAGLIKTLKKDGILILNADNKDVLDLKSRTKSRVLTFGFSEKADIRGSSEQIFYNEKNIPTGIIFRVDEKDRSVPVVVEGVFGKNHIYASLIALTVSSGLKLNMIESAGKLKNYEVPPGRMRLLEGIKDSFIIDDTYNSSPFACESALNTLEQIKSSGRKIAILGDMLELGKHTEESHKQIGQIASTFVDMLVVVGPRAEHIKNGALENGFSDDKIFSFANSYEAGDFIKNELKEGDFILVKGSQGVRMERIVGEILLDQANKSKLVVRQDKEWLEKR